MKFQIRLKSMKDLSGLPLKSQSSHPTLSKCYLSSFQKIFKFTFESEQNVLMLSDGLKLIHQYPVDITQFKVFVIKTHLFCNKNRSLI